LLPTKPATPVTTTRRCTCQLSFGIERIEFKGISRPGILSTNDPVE
jgi:hypothetical protein